VTANPVPVPGTKEQPLNISDLLSSVMRRPVPPITSSTKLVEIPGWDSVIMVRLMLTLEETLGRELSESEIEVVATVADVERIISPG
jgi:acyl carrier protein